MTPGAKASGVGSGFRPEQVRSACQASLARLGVEVLDVYMLHWPDDTGVPLADTWGAMASLVDEGLVRAKYVGTPWEDSGYFRLMFGPDTGPRTQKVVDGLRELAAQLGISISQLALGWVLRQPGVASAIAGSSSPERVRANATAADLQLPETAVRAVNDLIPLGPAFA